MKDFFQTSSNYSTSSVPPLTIESLRAMIDKFPPRPPTQEFTFNDGLIHGVYEDGKIRVSKWLLDKLKERFSPMALVASPQPIELAGVSAALNGTPVFVDESLPRLPKPAFPIPFPHE